MILTLAPFILYPRVWVGPHFSLRGHNLDMLLTEGPFIHYPHWWVGSYFSLRGIINAPDSGTIHSLSSCVGGTPLLPQRAYNLAMLLTEGPFNLYPHVWVGSHFSLTQRA